MRVLHGGRVYLGAIGAREEKYECDIVGIDIKSEMIPQQRNSGIVTEKGAPLTIEDAKPTTP